MRIAFLGTGLLGSGFVRGLLGRGHEVTVWNRSADKTRPLAAEGARVAADPAAAARGAERLFLALSDDAAVDAVLGAALPALADGVPVLDITTTAPLPTRARGERLAAAGRPFLHTPVFMTPAMAEKAQGSMICAGPEELFARLQPELASMTGKVTYLGPDLARAAAFKLFGNAMLFSVIAGFADVLAMARAVGVAPAEVREFLVQLNPARTLELRGAAMARGDYTPSFELTMARKDARLMIETAGDAALTLLPALAARMDALIDAGHGRDDMGVISKP